MVAAGKKLEWIEAMRGLAAVWVLVSHSAIAARDFSGLPEHRWPILFNGFLGVDFFFVLSGFIIAFTCEKLAASGKGWRDYITARAIRIYVPYLPVGVAMLLLISLIPTLSLGTRTEISALTSLTLLPANAPPALSVAWTLVHEIIFYTVFSLYFISRRLLYIALAGWAAAIAVSWVLHPAVPLSVRYVLSPLNLCFMLGVLTAWGTRRGVCGRAGFALALFGVVLVGSQAALADPYRPLAALGFAALVAASRCRAATSRSPGRALLILGAASYSIYLVHNAAVSVLVRGARRLGDPLLVCSVVGIGALAAGLLYHLLYERGALKAVRSLFARQVAALPQLGQSR